MSLLRSLLGGREYGAAGGSAAAMAAVVKGSENAARWQAGAEGEKLTALWLRPLTYVGWVLLNDRKVPGDRINLDHVLIGPRGVFCVDSKRWAWTKLSQRRGTLYREEQEVDLAMSVREAQIVSSRLGTKVVPIVCVHGCSLPLEGIRSRTTYGGSRVLVVSAKGLLWNVLRSERRLDRDRIEHLTKLAMQHFSGYSAAAPPWWWS